MASVPEDTRFGARRAQILRAAAACFNEKGYSGTSLKDVAKRLDLTDAALYYYVRNKEELVYQCYLRAAELGAEAMDAAEQFPGTGYEQVRAYIQNHIDIMVGARGPLAIMSEIPALEADHRQHVLDVSRRQSRRFEALLEAGVADGSIGECPVRMTGNAIMGAINWIPKWFHGDRTTAKDVLAEFPDILTRGLRPR